MKRRAILRISPDILVTFLTGLQGSGDQRARAFRVDAHALPEDVALVRVCYDDDGSARDNAVLLVLESVHFVIAPDASIHRSGYPYLESPTCRVEYFT